MNGDYIISTDKAKLEIDIIHDFLSNRSYWAKGRSLEIVRRSIDHSLCFGAYDQADRQVGFARVITDFAVLAYLLDVFVLEDHRGRGVGKLLVKSIVEHPDLKGVRVWRLDTQDAHGLYKKFGFTDIKFPDRVMEIRRPPPR
jgi:GNAT superfamily N-acetyltransferase